MIMMIMTIVRKIWFINWCDWSNDSLGATDNGVGDGDDDEGNGDDDEGDGDLFVLFVCLVS